MDKLSAVLPTVLRRRGLSAHANGALVVHRAAAWMSEQLPALSPVVRVTRVQEGVLFIACQHSIAVQECQSRSGALMQYLQLECPFEPVSEVRIVRE